MRRYALIAFAMIVVFLLLFGIVQAMGIEVLVDPSPWLNQGGVIAAGVGIALLLADVLLPVPSSLVMLANGALFGVWMGTALSMVGSVGATLFAFWLGRRGGPLLDRLITAEERTQADKFLAQWGTVAIIASRPIPLIAETTAILAGTTTMRWRSLFFGAIAGNLPPALLYAVTGATAASVGQTWLVFGLVLLIAGGFWWAARRAAPA